MTVAVEIDRVHAEAVGHELRHAHRAGIRAGGHGRRDVFFFGKAQEVAELLAEEFAASRIVKAEGMQCVEHTVPAGKRAIAGFDTEDGDDDLRRHTVFFLGTREGVGMLAPEVDTAVDAFGLEKDRAVLGPVQGLFRGPRDRLEDALLRNGLVQRLGQIVTLEAVALHHVVDEFVAQLVWRFGVDGARQGERTTQ